MSELADDPDLVERPTKTGASFNREHSELLELLRKSSIKSTPQKTESGKGNE